MKVTYITYNSWDGSTTASFNRVNLLVDGLKLNGVNADLFCLNTIKSNSFTVRRIWSYFNLLKIASKLIFASKGEIIIIYGEHSKMNIFTKLIPKRARLLVERTEYSTYQIRQNLSQKLIDSNKKFEQSLSKVSGMITCSGFLERYYRQFLNDSASICVIPLVVDLSKFTPSTSPAKDYIAYCGDFGGNKDGLPILLESFSIVSKQFPQYKLYLIGNTSEVNVMEQLQKRINDLNIIDKVVFTGRVNHNEMPKLLSEASLLVLARPNNKQAEGGIPSKLAEYLATARPTLITRVGELEKYLVHKQDVYFAQPDSVEDFSQKMIEIFSDYNTAIQIGKNGAKAAHQFDNIEQAKQLNNFLTIF